MEKENTQGENSQRTLLGCIEQWYNATAEYCNWNLFGTSAHTNRLWIGGNVGCFYSDCRSIAGKWITTALANMEHPTDNDYNSVFWFSAIMGWISYIVLFFSAPLIAAFFHHSELISLSRFVFASLLFSSLGTAPSAYLLKHDGQRDSFAAYHQPYYFRVW